MNFKEINIRSQNGEGDSKLLRTVCCKWRGIPELFEPDIKAAVFQMEPLRGANTDVPCGDLLPYPRSFIRSGAIL
jgi:hypothetical protein